MFLVHSDPFLAVGDTKPLRGHGWRKAEVTLPRPLGPWWVQATPGALVRFAFQHLLPVATQVFRSGFASVTRERALTPPEVGGPGGS